jgi:hypothetical protein
VRGSSPATHRTGVGKTARGTLTPQNAIIVSRATFDTVRRALVAASTSPPRKVAAK